MKLTVNTWERVMLGLVVGSAKGTVAMIRKAMKAMDILELSDDEQKQVGYIELPNGDVTWADNKRTFEIEFKDKEVPELIKRLFTQYKGWPASAGAQVLELEAKLGLGE